MKTTTGNQILECIKSHGQARAHDLQKTLRISRVAVHKQLKKLLQENVIMRVGKPPFVFYVINPEPKAPTNIKSAKLPEQTKKIIQSGFLYITPDGKLLYGVNGFEYWANLYQKNKPLVDIAEEYVKTFLAQKKLFAPQGWIDATSKLKDTFQEMYINHLLFQDVYSYKIFGRTKLAKLVMHAKQIGSRELILKISDIAKPVIEKIIRTYAIEAVAYIPPTVPRPIQFMDEFASNLNLSLPEIALVKAVPGDIPVPQKILARLDERIINARNSIYLKNTALPSYKNILLIDDVAGSGASFHETAKKLKAINSGYEITAFALVGNIKGYDVVREI